MYTQILKKIIRLKYLCCENITNYGRKPQLEHI